MVGEKKIKLEFSVNWLFGIVVIAAALILFYTFGPTEDRPALVFATAVIAGAAALTTAINALDSRISQARQAKVLAAVAVATSWNNPSFSQLKKHGREVIEFMSKHTDYADQVAYLEDGNKECLASLLDMLNFFEGLGIAVECDVVDSDTSKKFFRAVVDRYWHATEGYIKKRRAERQNTRLFSGLEKLFESWKDRT